MKVDPMLVRTLEELAANAWPAHVQQQFGPWRLRASRDLTRRANSVYCVGSMPPYAAWYDEVVAFYKRRHLPIRFQITDVSPEGLDPILQGMGFTAEAHSAVYRASCMDLIAPQSRVDGLRLTSSSNINSEWLDSFLRIEGHDEAKKRDYSRIMRAIGPPACFLQASLDGAVVGIGMGVAERDWVGMFNIATSPQHRRKGIGTAIVRALAEWGLDNGAADAYLQVLLTNSTAINLYIKLGFRYLYSYHYRVAQSDPRGQDAARRKVGREHL